MTSKHFAVVGDPIDHSLSPNIHSAAYEFLGLDWDYSRFQVPEGSLREFLGADGSHLAGISVTMPLKLEAAALASSGDEIVRELQIANTLLRKESEFIAFNTDVFGIEMALAQCWGSSIERVAILGSGATAQSALYAVSRKAAKAKVLIYARDLSRTQSIQSLGTKLGIAIDIRPLVTYSDEQDLTISTIPAAALDNLNQQDQGGWLLNVNYASKDSSFSRNFSSDKVVQGETMLIWQAIAQIRIFLSGSPEAEIDNETALFRKMSEAL
jgi:shikimate dehydrogenase